MSILFFNTINWLLNLIPKLIFSIRGALGSTKILTYNFGNLMAYILGNSCDYYTIPKFLLVLLVIYATSFSFFPESPTVLVKQNRIAVNIFIYSVLLGMQTKRNGRKKTHRMQRAQTNSILFVEFSSWKNFSQWGQRSLWVSESLSGSFCFFLVRSPHQVWLSPFLKSK